MKTIQEFNEWVGGLDFYRLPILVGMILIHGCITIPFTFLLASYTGTVDFVSIYLSIFTFGIVIVLNLAVQPMKIVIPAFIITSLAHFVIITLNVIKIFF